jgi:hypothetical protein
LAFTGLDHACTGEGCPVCLRIEGAQNLLRDLDPVDAAAFFSPAAPAAAFTRTAALFWPGLPTPIALKVKYTS